MHLVNSDERYREDRECGERTEDRVLRGRGLVEEVEEGVVLRVDEELAAAWW